jgi:hypothetical protein
MIHHELSQSFVIGSIRPLIRQLVKDWQRSPRTRAPNRANNIAIRASELSGLEMLQSFSRTRVSVGARRCAVDVTEEG